MQVLHKCDVKCCVNPDHLYVGTAKQNASDAVARKLLPLGTARKQAILTEQQVNLIRADNRSQRQIAIAYKISQVAVSKIKRRISWKHI